MVEVPSPRSGRIAALHGAKGDVVKVGAPLVEFATEAGEDAGTVVGTLERQRGKAASEITAQSRRARRKASGARASPAVKALAEKLNVDVDLLTPSGPDGTLTRADVERAAHGMTELGAGEPLRGMRRAMAQRMARAHREVVPAGAMDEADIGDWAPEKTYRSGSSVPLGRPVKPSRPSTRTISRRRASAT